MDFTNNLCNFLSVDPAQVHEGRFCDLSAVGHVQSTTANRLFSVLF